MKPRKRIQRVLKSPKKLRCLPIVVKDQLLDRLRSMSARFDDKSLEEEVISPLLKLDRLAANSPEFNQFLSQIEGLKFKNSIGHPQWFETANLDKVRSQFSRNPELISVCDRLDSSSTEAFSMIVFFSTCYALDLNPYHSLSLICRYLCELEKRPLADNLLEDVVGPIKAFSSIEETKTLFAKRSCPEGFATVYLDHILYHNELKFQRKFALNPVASQAFLSSAIDLEKFRSLEKLNATETNTDAKFVNRIAKRNVTFLHLKAIFEANKTKRDRHKHVLNLAWYYLGLEDPPNGDGRLESAIPSKSTSRKVSRQCLWKRPNNC